MAILIRVAALLLLSASMTGCSAAAAGRPFRIVELCLGNAQEASAFTETLKSIAQQEQMKFIDHSLETRRDLAVIKADSWQDNPSKWVIAMDMGRSDGLGLGVGNVGLPAYQVAVGFSRGRDMGKARAFSDRVVARLGGRWRVETVPPGAGAQPMKSCRG